MLPICTGAERLKDEGGAKAHPTQKPQSLLTRVILGSTNPGDVILDPFFGSGTTGAVARMLGRNFIGIEREAAYRKAANARIAAVEPLAAEAVATMVAKRSAPRIPFGSLIERGLIRPGDHLASPNGRHLAMVRVDGSVSSGPHSGSIHQVGAALEGAPSCNGWTYWSLRGAQGDVSIDVLRQKLRDADNGHTA